MRDDASVSEPQRTTLLALRSTLRSVLPTAHERISYGMATFAVDGKSVVSYAAFKNHCSYFPHSSNVFTAAGSAVAKYPVTKGTLQFPIDKPLPVGLVRTLVKLRSREISDVTSGKRIDYYDDPVLSNPLPTDNRSWQGASAQPGFLGHAQSTLGDEVLEDLRRPTGDARRTRHQERVGGLG